MTTAAPFRWPTPGTGLIAATDQSRDGRIVVYDLGPEYADEVVEAWSWAPAELPGWGRPTDVRLRRDDRGDPVMLVCDSFGAAAMVGPDGGVRWSHDLGDTANPHAIELTPVVEQTPAAGQTPVVEPTPAVEPVETPAPTPGVVVASSTEGSLRTFDSRGAEWEPFPLEGAHGLVWDQSADRLWALGTHRLHGLRADTLAGRWLIDTTADLPSTGGHDLWPVDGEDALWVTTESAVHRFEPAARRWAPVAPPVDRPRVKSIGDASGAVLLTVPDRDADPEWVTGSIRLIGAASRRITRDAAFYKARFWRFDRP